MDEKQLRFILSPFVGHGRFTERDIRKQCKNNEQFDALLIGNYIEKCGKDFYTSYYIVTQKGINLCQSN